MKKLYFLFALLFSIVGGAMAQDEVTITVNMENGKWISWNGVEANPWARTWFSTTTPAISICTAVGGQNAQNYVTDIRGKEFYAANNMSVWGTAKSDLMFFTKFGSADAPYEITVASGWYLTAVEFDFNCANNRDENDGSLEVILGDGEPVTSTSMDDIQHVSWINEADDEEIYSIQFTPRRIEGTYNFARTSNFTVKVKKMPEEAAALAELTGILHTYEKYRYAFMPGTEPGNYDPAAVQAFTQAIDDAHNIVDGGDPDAPAPTIEDYKNQGQLIKDTYEAVLKARNMTYTLADGYYRIKTGLQYTKTETVTDEESGEETQVVTNPEKYMYSVLEGEKFFARWGTPDDAATDCSILWKVTNKEDGLDIVNMATDTRFNNVARSTNAAMSLSSENLIALDPVITLEGTTYTNIRISSQDGAQGLYLHQGGHGGGTGNGGYLVGWYTSLTAPTSDAETFKLGGSEWQFIPVSDEEAQAIIEAYGPIKDETLMRERYKLMVSDAKAKLEIARDIKSDVSDEALITDESQLSSPYSDSSEGTSFAALLDANTTTYWHSDWHNGSQPNGTHYLKVEINEADVEAVALTFTRRAVSNDHITQWAVYGTNDTYEPTDTIDKANCELLATLNTPFTSNTETITTDAFYTKGYKSLLFFINATTSNRGYGHASEFQLYKATIIDSPTTQYKVMGDIATNLESVLNQQADIEIADLTSEQYEAMKVVYDAFIEKFVDPTELRETLANVAGVSAGVVNGDKPGYWSDSNVGATLAATVAAADAYDKAGAYTQEQSDKYIEDLKAQAEHIMTVANSIKEGKWYRLRFASEQDFEDHGWDKLAGYNAANSDEPLWDKYITVAHYEKTDEGYVIEALDAEDANLGENIFLDADEDIDDKDMSMFRFINVGDSAYIMQNKATGLYLQATSGASIVKLNLHPSLFNVKAIGYGFNLIAVKDINGESQNYLHGQKQSNVLVTWNAYALGSASGYYIEEAGDVEADYEGTANVGVVYGAMNGFCFPVEITNISEGQAWSVTSVEGNNISLCKIEDKIDAGRPFIYIYGETADYVEDDEPEHVVFTVNPQVIAREAQAGDALKGTYTQVKIDRGDVFCKGNQLVVNKVGKDDIMVTYTYVNANGAYITGETPLDPNAELIVNFDKEAVDGIQTALNQVAKTGEIYTIDGKLMNRKGNLNDLQRYGKGIYILNGVKVVVK